VTLSLDRQNQYRERFRRARTGWQPATEVYEGMIRAALRPGSHVLDIGCGRGGVLEQVGDGVDHPFGIDPDGVSLVEHRLTDLPRAVALADALPFKSQAFDVILCSWVLEHLTRPAWVFVEISRCLKPGGKFIFLTPNKNALVTLLNRTLKPAQAFLVPRLYGRKEADTFPVMYRANTRQSLTRYAETFGLQMEDLRAIPDPTYLAFNPLFYRLSVLISRVTPPVHLVGCCRRAAPYV
jgi:ubiquinone/menaquinone biosynthesis C-methylase UbiE